MLNPKSQIHISRLKFKPKRFMILVLFLSFGFLVLSFKNVLAQSKVLINEFLIDPQPQQVEIINFGNENVDISGWLIDDSGGSTFYTIPQSSILHSNSCLIFSGDFNLNKTSPDTIKLLNGSTIIDSFSYKASSGSGVSYFKIPDEENNWTTGSASLGKFNSSELSCLMTPTPSLTSEEFLEPTNIPEPKLPSYDNIYISEVMTTPVSGNNEWVEIFNNNDYLVKLENWFVDDLENAGSSPKNFSLEISAKSYKSFNLASSMFNNDKDSVRLLDFNKNLKDSFEYNYAASGKTFGRKSIDDDNFCLQDPSYELQNSPCINYNLSPTPTQSLNIAPTPITINSSSDKPIKKPLKYQLPVNDSVSQSIDPIKGEVLGIVNKHKGNQTLLIKILSSISFSYSLLTIVTVLFKMKIVYAEAKRFFSAFIYSE